ncbi:acyltransferase family protein [Sphingobacterium sp. FBM7-1]|uniref:acyltransferase family protein n=1 Tax=Sphingobacterium sp. FBM7-1 TaxID=2886688 RepID=UPI001D0FF3A6|nr:DUF5009 domain-containing protein [Sphingobacterium sp. FBM7-1]MCC2599621.1 DUF5009 domain-containing protein [Sphingobacterium sp. FBM7-1]
MVANQRYYSLDVFRGATVALMILVNNPGTWAYMFAPLKHAAWHGCTPTDLVFPFFLFAVGNAMAFVMPKLQDAGQAVFWRKVLKRTILIFVIGLFLNWWPFVHWVGDELRFRAWVDPDNAAHGVRIFGVLQRIAVSYFFAAVLVYFFKPKSVIYISFIVLLVYWGLCAFLGQGDPYSLEGWFGTAIDKQVLGVAHLYKGEGVPFDPEGLMSTIPAIVQVVFGYLVGLFIRQQGKVSPDFRFLSGLLVTGFLLVVLGWIWSLGFPINKKIWTSSYVLYTTGLGILTLGSMIWFLEIQGIKNGVTKFFDVFGKNPLFIFVLSGLLPRFLTLFRIPDGMNTEGDPQYLTALSWFYKYVCAKIPGPPELGSLVYSLCFLALMWALCYVLDKKKVYVKV